eukprot:3857786-Prymnesium_polylepis.1
MRSAKAQSAGAKPPWEERMRSAAKAQRAGATPPWEERLRENTKAQRAGGVPHFFEEQMRSTQTRSGGGVPTGHRAAAATDPSILIQGGSLRTWTYNNPAIEQVQVFLGNKGSALDADIELWHGPDNAPIKLRVHVENGKLRPFSTVIDTPRGSDMYHASNTVAIRNIGEVGLPLSAEVVAEDVDSRAMNGTASTILGGADRKYSFEPAVDSVRVFLGSNALLSARVELLQEDSSKQVIDVETNDGHSRPFFCIIETPGAGSVVRVVNTDPLDLPITAFVAPHAINESVAADAPLVDAAAE